MGKIYRVTITGTGQLNGARSLNKIVEVDENTAKLFSSNKEAVCSDFVKQHFPGVKFNPKDIGVNLVYLGTEEELAKKNQKKNTTKIKSEPTISSVTNTNNYTENKVSTGKDPDKESEEIYIRDLRKSVNQKIDEIENIKIPNEKNELFELFDDLSYKLSLYKWKPFIGATNKEEEAKLINSLMGAYLLKYTFCLKKLESLNVSADELLPYQLELKKLKKRRFLGNFSTVLIFLGVVFIFWILWLLGIIHD